MSEERFRLLFQRSPIGLVVADESGGILTCNPAFATLLGYDDPASLVGRSLDELRAPVDESEDESEEREELGVERETDPRDVPFRRHDGATVWALQQRVPLSGWGDEEEAFLHAVVDIDARKEEEWGLAEMAYHDPLTGLANRRLLAIHAPRILSLADRQEGQAALFFVDLVGFKEINDRFGHRQGDRALVEVADRLRHNLRSGDISSRTGGDEFAVLLGQVEGAEGAVQSARRLRRELGKPVELDGEDVELDARFGIALYPEDGEDLDSLLGAADEALTRSKATGERIARAS